MNKQDIEKAKVRELARKHQGTMTDAQYLQMTYALEEMASWKDSEFEKKVTQVLCIDCHEYETCEKCAKYNLKEELLNSL